MTVSKEAVEAADAIWRAYPKKYTSTLAKDMITAALPFLAPKPSQNGEERAIKVCDDMGEYATNWEECLPYMTDALAAVRAEEREECIRMADEARTKEELIAAIRARKP